MKLLAVCVFIFLITPGLCVAYCKKSVVVVTPSATNITVIEGENFNVSCRYDQGVPLGPKSYVSLAIAKFENQIPANTVYEQNGNKPVIILVNHIVVKSFFQNLTSGKGLLSVAWMNVQLNHTGLYACRYISLLCSSIEYFNLTVYPKEPPTPGPSGPTEESVFVWGIVFIVIALVVTALVVSMFYTGPRHLRVFYKRDNSVQIESGKQQEINRAPYCVFVIVCVVNVVAIILLVVSVSEKQTAFDHILIVGMTLVAMATVVAIIGLFWVIKLRKR